MLLQMARALLGETPIFLKKTSSNEQKARAPASMVKTEAEKTPGNPIDF
jgi:hypothetical protein